jgi:amidase
MTLHPFSTASEQLAALTAGDVSSVELVESHLDRIAARNAEINAIVVHTPERALAAARDADKARATGGPGALPRRRLLGLPMTLKESTQVAGLPQSAGFPDLAEHRPADDGPVARAVFDAGACLLGTTNIPTALGDWQADSPNYGRTSNPWDPTRTPGGSTGGGAAALAAGLTPLEVGSDIGGSIRVPAAYCGVYGHRPSESAVARHGAFPRGDVPNPARVMGVQGPMARSAADLELLLDVLAGPVVGEDAGWRLQLPAARHDRLADFRVAIMPPLPWAQPAATLQDAVDELAAFLSAEGAAVATAMPDVSLDDYLTDYHRLLVAMTSPPGKTLDERRAKAEALRGASPLGDAVADGMTLDALDLIALLGRREHVRAAWRDFFRDWDVLVAPNALGSAFEHRDGPQTSRTLDIDGVDVPYALNIVYAMWAVYTGQPATAFPAGVGTDGLPRGLQAIGGYLEDRTTLRFAQLLERAWHHFEPPPGW